MMEQAGKRNRSVRLLALALVALLFCAMMPSCSKQDSTDSWQEQYNLGTRYLSEGDYEQAVLAFTAAIEIDPKRPEAYAEAAQAYLGLEDMESAIIAFEQGYVATGDTALQREAEKLKEKSASSLNEEPGLHIAYEATTMDGICHHAYLKYELPEEVQNLFDTLIAYTQAGRYEDCAEMMTILQVSELANQLATQHKEYYVDNIRVAYKGYKILIDLLWGIVLIPALDGIGAMYYYNNNWVGSDQEFGAIERIVYTHGECRDGMFNGSFVTTAVTRIQAVGHVAVETTEGEIKNGLIDGQVTTQYDNPPINGTHYFGQPIGSGSYYVVYANGRIDKYEVVEEEVFGEQINRALTIFNEDGTPRTDGVIYRVEELKDQIYWLNSTGITQSSLSNIRENSTLDWADAMSVPDGTLDIFPY